MEGPGLQNQLFNIVFNILYLLIDCSFDVFNIITSYIDFIVFRISNNRAPAGRRAPGGGRRGASRRDAGRRGAGRRGAGAQRPYK